MKKIENKYEVPVKLWKSFSTPIGKNTFNLVFHNTIGNQMNLTHPEQKLLPKEQWKTLCWNFACESAWAVDGAIQNEKGVKA